MISKREEEQRRVRVEGGREGGERAGGEERLEHAVLSGEVECKNKGVRDK